MNPTVLIILLVAAASFAILFALKRSGSRFYNRSAGFGIYMTLLPIAMMAFHGTPWVQVRPIAVVAIAIWCFDPAKRLN